MLTRSKIRVHELKKSDGASEMQRNWKTFDVNMEQYLNDTHILLEEWENIAGIYSMGAAELWGLTQLHDDETADRL